MSAKKEVKIIKNDTQKPGSGRTDTQKPGNLRTDNKKPDSLRTIVDLFSHDICEDDLVSVVDAEVDQNTLVGHHINSFNNFMSAGITQIVTQNFKVERTLVNARNKTPEDTQIDLIFFEVIFNKVEAGFPSTRNFNSGKQIPLFPNGARKNNLNYSAALYVDATITAKAFPKDGGEPKIRTEEVKGFQIASIPIMVGSESCNTFNLSRDARKKVEEDPNDPGGYFILKGGEWVISMIETRLFNHAHVFRNVGHEKEIARLEFISKPGDAYENSSEMIMRYVTNKNIYLNFTSNQHLKLLNIPFYVIFRLLGMTTDKEIIDNIIFGYSTPEKKDVVSEHMLGVLKNAFRAHDADFGDSVNITDQGKLLEYFSKRTSVVYQTKTAAPTSSKEKDKEAEDNLIKYLNANVLKLLDKHVFPHIGLAADSRHKKLRFLGRCIHKLLLVEMQIVASTDRDSLKNKRINPAGKAYAKSFKTQFNLSVIQSIKKKLSRDFKSMPFSQVPLAQSFKAAIHGPDLEKALIQAIVTGNKEITVKNRQVPNRLASEMLHRKNQLNFISTMNVIRTPSTSANKQDQRADEMRRVHPSNTGFICPIQSADTGEQVGMVKQKTLESSIVEASSSELLKDTLLKDSEIIPLYKIFPEVKHKFGLTDILVNGDCIGCCYDSPRIVRKYKEYRRGYRCIGAESSYDDGGYEFVNNSISLDGIDSMCTIHWDTDSNEINFWVDSGRMMRPVLVVRNNGELDSIGREMFGFAYDAMTDPIVIDNVIVPGCFVQDIILTKSDIDALMQKGMTIKELHERGIIDYISPEEMENCFIAPSLDVIKENQFNALQQYTHCEIPQGLFGLPALTCPYAHHNQPPRITFQTNQVKQTCGWYSLNYPYRIDKHSFLQYYCEVPLIKTLANKYIYPNGKNTIVAIDCYGGFNEEDSLIYNKSGAERGNYKGIAYNFIKTEIDKDEKFDTPDESNTILDKKHADYSKLHKGKVVEGTMLHKDDAVIGKLLLLPKPSDHRIYKDASILFPYNEPAMVELVLTSRNQDDEEFCKVKFSSVRSLGIGDKFCLTNDHEVLTTQGWISIENVTIEHNVATLNYLGEIEYQNPTNTVEFDHNDEIYSIENNQVVLKTTLNHKMYTSLEKPTNKDFVELYELTEVQNLIGSKRYYKKNAINPNFDLDEWNILANRKQDKNWSFNTSEIINAWIWFLGIYLSEGHVDKSGSIRIATHKDRIKDKLDEILPILGLRYISYETDENCWYIRAIEGNCVAIARYLSRTCYKFLTENKKYIAGNKCMPIECWSLGQDQCILLIEALCLGDGYKDSRRENSMEYYSSSKQLSDDFQRLCLHAGYACNLVLKREKGETLSIKGIETKRNFDAYRMIIMKHIDHLCPPITHHETTEMFNGKVYCIEIPNHIFYIRSKGIRQVGVWNGNSSRAG